MRVVAILATYNEERFIAPCLENLFRQGIQAYLIDNDSRDQTVAIARRYLGRGRAAYVEKPLPKLADVTELVHDVGGSRHRSRRALIERAHA